MITPLTIMHILYSYMEPLECLFEVHETMYDYIWNMGRNIGNGLASTATLAVQLPTYLVAHGS